jgi:hypothetical protein
MSVTKDVDRFGYIPVGGLALTVTSPVLPAASTTGPLKSSINSDLLSFEDANQINVNLSVTALSAGASVGVSLLILDPLEPGNIIASVPLLATPINSPANLRLVLSTVQSQVIIKGAASGLPFYGVPLVFQLAFTVSGTSPSVSVVGTYEVFF